MDYKNVFPIEKQCTWDEIGKFYPSQYLIAALAHVSRTKCSEI